MKKLLFVLGLTVALSSCKTIAPIFISDEDEKQVGLDYHKYLLDSLTKENKILSSNSAVSRWVDSVGKKMADQQGRKNFTRNDFTFTVVDEDIINAFALPGGYIYIYQGLIDKATSADQIVGVIAHEVGHVSAQHYKEVMMKTATVEILSQIIAGDKGSVGLNVGKYLIAMKGSRGNEYEADSLAVAYVSKDNYYSPWGMKNFMDILASLSGGKNVEILSSHPNSEKRSAEISRMIKDYYHSQSGIADNHPKP